MLHTKVVHLTEKLHTQFQGLENVEGSIFGEVTYAGTDLPPIVTRYQHQISNRPSFVLACRRV